MPRPLIIFVFNLLGLVWGSPEDLIRCCRTGKIEELRARLENGEDPNISYEGRIFPLSWACQVGCRRSVKLLLEYGADPNVTCICSKESVLYRCARFGDYDIMKSLLESGANPDFGDGVSGASPIEIAMSWNKEEVALLLLWHGADPTRKCANGDTLIRTAVEMGMARIVSKLLGMLLVPVAEQQVLKRLAKGCKDRAVLHVLEDYERFALLSLSTGDSQSDFYSDHFPQEISSTVQSFIFSSFNI